MFNKTTCEHGNHVVYPDHGLLNQLKLFIQEKYLDGIKRHAILNLIKKCKLVEPPKSELVAFLRTLQVEKFSKLMTSANKLRSRCMEHIKIPSKEDKPFVLNHYPLVNSSLL